MLITLEIRREAKNILTHLCDANESHVNQKSDSNQKYVKTIITIVQAKNI